eukprot:3696392-Amphidinium_carterae.1
MAWVDHAELPAMLQHAQHAVLRIACACRFVIGIDVSADMLALCPAVLCSEIACQLHVLSAVK